MKTIYLHIGFGKTGTSAVQQFFFSNQEELAELGLLYPATGRTCYAHHGLALYEPVEMPKGVEGLYKTLLEEIASTPANRILISSEQFCFLKRLYIVKIKELLSGYDVKVIFYVRSQLKLIESTFLEWQKAGWKYKNNIEQFYKETKASFDFSVRIQPWIEEFGIDNIIVRVYDYRTIGDNTCLDVMKILGIKLTNKMREVNNRANPSLIPEFSTLISIIDRDEAAKDHRKEIVGELLALSRIFKPASTHKLIGEKLRSEIEGYYKTSNHTFSIQLLKQEDADVFLDGCITE